MKKIFTLIALIIIIFSGCNQSKDKKAQKENKEKFKLDSISSVKAEQQQIEKAKQDSLVTIEQEKVFGTIIFGMSEKIVESKIKEFKKESRKPYKIMDKTFYKYYIGNFQFSFIRPLYYQNKIYKVTFIGSPIQWDDFDFEVPREIKAISDILKEKYGDSDIHYDLKPMHRMQRNHTYLIDLWNIGNKEIKVTISDEGTTYWVHLVIMKPEIKNRIIQEQKENENQETLKGKDVF